MQRSLPVFLLGCRVSAVLDEELHEIQMSPFGRLMQRSLPVFVLGCRVRTVLDEELRKIQITP